MSTPECAQDVNAGASGSQSGQPLQESGQLTSFPAGQLIVRYQGALPAGAMQQIHEKLSPVAQALNLQPILLTQGSEPEQTAHQALLAAIGAQVEAINRLAASNEALVRAMAEADEEGDGPGHSATYMDGSQKR